MWNCLEFHWVSAAKLHTFWDILKFLVTMMHSAQLWDWSAPPLVTVGAVRFDMHSHQASFELGL